jgi:hypothetical protein
MAFSSYLSKQPPVVLSPVVPHSAEALPQRLAARLTGSLWFWTIFVLTVFALPLARSIVRQLPAAPPVLGVFPDFSMTDQTGRPFESSGVRGHILIVEFVPATSFAGGSRSPLADLQRRVRNTGDAVHLVSFVTTPGAATDHTLEELARGERAGAWRWTLAGGPTQALEGATLAALGDVKPGSLAGRLLLVDGTGRIRRVTGPSKEEIDLMMRDIGLLANLEGKR